MSVKASKRHENPMGSVLDRHQGELFRFLRRRVRNPEDVRDLAQEVYLRLLRVEDPTAILKPLAYIYRTASNAVAEFCMRQRRERERVLFDSETAHERSEHPLETSTDDLLECLNDEYALKHALDRLSPLYCTILILRACEGLSYVDIAKQLDLSPNTVKQYFYNAMALVGTADST